MYAFETEVLKKDIVRFIRIPEKVSIAFNKKGHIPVKGILNNYSFRGTLAPRKNNRHILYLNQEIRAGASIEAGDKVQVSIEYDSKSREMDIPEDLELIMSENRQNLDKFLKMTTSHRNELLKYLASAKRPETRLKRINKIIEHTINWKSGDKFFS